MQALLLKKLKGCESASEFLALLHVVAKTSTQHDTLFLTSFVEQVTLKLKTLFFDQGELPPREILLLSLVFKEVLHVSLESSLKRYFETLVQAFWGEYEKLGDAQSEKYLYHALICVCELLTLGYETSIKRYIKRTMLLDTRGVNLENEWVRAFEYHLSMDTFEMALVMEAISELIEPSFFFALSKEHQRAIFFWWLHVIWTHPAYMNHPSWGTFEKALALLCQEALLRNELATQMYIHFFAYQILGNLAQTQEEWKRFNEAFNLPQSNYVKSLHVKALEAFTNPKKKIVFVKDRIVENSPFKVEYSLLSALMNDEVFTQNYEPYVLSMGYIDKAPDQKEAVKKLENLGIKVVSPAQSVHQGEQYYDHLTKAMLIREWFLEHHIDIIVGCVNGYDIMNFLFVTRCAPKQIYWSHGDFQYDVAGIDKRISHISESKHMNIYDFKQVYIPQDTKADLKLQNLNIDTIMNIREQFPKNKIILGSIGRLVKLDSDEYFRKIALIMEKRPETIYLACGSGNQVTIKEKIDLYHLNGRFFFPGFVDPRIYSFIIDVYLDTFPETSGEAIAEYSYLKKGFGVVYASEKDYVNKALHYIDGLYCNFSFEDFYESLRLTNPLLKKNFYLNKINKGNNLSIVFYCPPVLLLDKNLLMPILELIKQVQEVHFQIYSSHSLCAKLNQTLLKQIYSHHNVKFIDIEFLKDNVIKKDYDLILLYQDVDLSYDTYAEEDSLLWLSYEVFSSSKTYAEYFYPSGTMTKGAFDLNFVDICEKNGVESKLIERLVQESIRLKPFQYYVMLLKELSKSKTLLSAYKIFSNQSKTLLNTIFSRKFTDII